MAAQADGKWQKDAADQNFDYMFKLLIIGNSSERAFVWKCHAYIYISVTDRVSRCCHRVCLQDTAGQERYRTITTAYYRGAMGFLLMYDVTNEDSFNSVMDWCDEVETSAKENVNVKQVFERLVDIICEKMTESLDSDPTIVSAAKGTRLTENPIPQTSSCQC
ncbi:PREDICTED: ras-related protein Rab-3-like [Priapulus caudatus]|uniref:Ras-related protein Rab-3-like n=1 Tax=Priapulus caudatus TaxID=37621 RepID=A0ABM1EYN7_PRICU|nr:PREDICTED: ras-related protein Rab-3-like [Priapulus caudatus]